ncbi:glutamate--tRNA ligase [Patescibacteria group bacterium]|nr:MAG: glutamate--tRNA ligase [Patescibacteria group bacterium]
MKQPIRVRFAPSPTGYLHIGNLRSALFSYLYARHTNGKFILRIEDTDRERLVPEALDYIYETFEWMGLETDESPKNPNSKYAPYIQSERLQQFQDFANQLVEEGKAYRDYTSAEQLEKLRQEAQAAKQPFRFTKAMAKLNPDNPDDPYVIRFLVQDGPKVTWSDAVWGDQSWDRSVLDDFVAIKSDGFPTYNFAVVVDDNAMDITHVFRGSEFISTTPKNLLIYDAFGWKPPVYAHLPQVLGQDKAKLSKRHGAKSALEYRDAGYLPEAIFNYLASLGFNDGTTKEFYTKAELIKVFATNRIQSSPAVFDPERLDWMNGHYARQLSLEELYRRSENFWPESAQAADAAYKKQVLGLVQERLKFLAELPGLTEFFFTEPAVDKRLITKQLADDQVKDLLPKIINLLEASDFSEADLEKKLRGLVGGEGLKTGHLFGLIRAAVTGQSASPGLFETLHVIGKERSLKRLNYFLSHC